MPGLDAARQAVVTSFMLIAFLVSFVLFYLWHMMGVTIGYHRLLSHRSFTCPKLVEYFWVLGGYLAFEGSPIWWATMHRAHHRWTDGPLDPHAPRYGIKQAFQGWVLHDTYPSHIDPDSQSKDLMRDPIYRFLEQGGHWRRAFMVNLIIGIVVRLLLLVSFGWVIALSNLAAALTVQQIPLLLNVVCHIPKLGYKNFATPDDSVNVWWVALLTTGEGWHNNHHAFPGSARSGLRPFELDLSWQTICLMKLVGLIPWMNEAGVAVKGKVTRSAALHAIRPAGLHAIELSELHSTRPSGLHATELSELQSTRPAGLHATELSELQTTMPAGLHSSNTAV